MLILDHYIVLTFVHMNINMAPEFSELYFLHSKEHTIFKLNMYDSTHIPEVIQNDEVMLGTAFVPASRGFPCFFLFEGGDDVLYER